MRHRAKANRIARVLDRCVCRSARSLDKRLLLHALGSVIGARTFAPRDRRISRASYRRLDFERVRTIPQGNCYVNYVNIRSLDCLNPWLVSGGLAPVRGGDLRKLIAAVDRFDYHPDQFAQSPSAMRAKL